MRQLTDEQKGVAITMGQNVTRFFTEQVQEHLVEKEWDVRDGLKILVAVIAGFAVDIIESVHAFFDDKNDGMDAQKYMADAVIQSIAQLLRRKGIVPDHVAKVLKVVEGAMLRDMAPGDDEIVH